MKLLTAQESADFDKKRKRGPKVQHVGCVKCHKGKHHARGLCDRCYYLHYRRKQREGDTEQMEEVDP